mmetsp:Transcript_16884/g.29061  ORF Transcript_16884/g.29061 Transcript_16884/m.29061 type:complete len:252 (+) Transcript_16884:97-852(+)
MKSMIALALAPAALAFQPSTGSDRPSVALQNTLRDMASYPDNNANQQRMMGDFEAFDRNGAFSRSPRGGMNGRPEMMYGGDGGGYGGGGGNPNPFSRRGGGGMGGADRMYTQDGFDPYSAFGTSFGMSQSDRRVRGGGYEGPRGGMDYYGDMMMMGGGTDGRSMMMGGEMNGVHNDNTIAGFSYSSRVRERMGERGGPGGPPMMGGGGGGYGEYDPGMMFYDEPMMGEYGYPEGGGPDGGYGYGGFDDLAP